MPATMLSRLRIGPKLLLAPGVVLILLLVVSVGAYVGMVRQNQSLEVLVQQRAARIKAADDLVAGANRAHTEIYQLLTWISGSFSAPRLDALVRDIHARHAALDRQFAQLELAIQAGQGARLGPSDAELRFVAQSQAAHALYVQAIADVIEIGMADQSIAANAMSKAERAFDVVAQRLEELARLEQSLSERAHADAEAEFQLLSTALPVVVALSIVLSLLVTMAVRKALLDEVREIGAAAHDLAEGKLTVKTRVYGRDEIAETSRALDASIRILNATLKTVVTSAQAIGIASRDITLDNADLALVEQAAAAASSLQRQALDLSQAVARFQLDEGAGAGTEGGTKKNAGQDRVVRLRLASGHAATRAADWTSGGEKHALKSRENSAPPAETPPRA